jgi:carbamoyl-phosphate synthase large subunit
VGTRLAEERLLGDLIGCIIRVVGVRAPPVMSQDSTRTTGTNDGSDVSLLLTGVGAPGAPDVIRALRNADAFDPRIVGADEDPDAHGFGLVDAAHTVPPETPDERVDTLLSVALDEGVDVVLPLETADLRALAEAKPNFENEGVEVMLSDPDVLSVVTDTGRLYGELAKRAHPAAPEFARASSRDEFVDAVRALGYPETRVRVDLTAGGDARGSRVLEAEPDRSEVLTNRTRNGVATTLGDALSDFDDDSFPEFVVAEYLPGDEYGVDVLAREEDVPVVVPRSRAGTRAGITVGRAVERDRELVDSAREVCDLLGVEYNVGLRFRYAADGTPKITEIDPGISAAVAACGGADVNVPALGVRYALGRELPEADLERKTIRSRRDACYGPGKETTNI